MDAYERCTNLGKKNLADSVAIYGRGRELFRPPTYCYYLSVSVCGQINSMTERILISQSEYISTFLISLQTLLSVPGLYSFHNVNFFSGYTYHELMNNAV
jgi:hypothetical protein